MTKLGKLVIGFILVVVIVCGAWIVLSRADEKETLQWKARALVAEANMAQRAIQEFMKELDSKGYTIQQDGQVVEKPKAPEKPAPPAPKK